MHIDLEVERPLSVYRVSCPDALMTLQHEWEELEKDIFPRTPFTSPLWLGLWWKYLRRRHIVFRDEFFCHILRDGSGKLVAVAPLMKTFAPGLGPAGLRLVQFFGCDPSLTELRGVVCRPKDHTRVIVTLAEHFLRHRAEWDVFRWSGLRRQASHFNDFPSNLHFVARRDLSDYVIDLPPTWDGLKARVSSNTRKNLRKAYEFLERDGHGFAVRVIDRPDDVPTAIDRFFSLHAARSEAANMIDHPNKFAKLHNRAFLTDYLRQSAERGQFRLFELEIGGKVVASRLAFLLDTDLYMYYAGYDPSWKNYSVMTTLICEIMKWAISGGLRRVNLSTGTDQSKLRWKPEEVVFSEAVQCSPTWRGRLSFHLFRLYETLSDIRARVKL